MFVPSYSAIGTDVTEFEAVGIFQGRNCLRHGMRRGLIEGSGRLLIQGLMRAFEVKLMAEAIEFALLAVAGVSRGSGGFGFEGSMHAFMAAVLLWFTRFDELGHDAQLDPPCGQMGEAGQGVGGKGHAVVSADALGQAKFLEQTSEDRFRLCHAGGAQRLAAEQEAAEAIGDGERITVQSIAGFELPLKVGTPYVVGCQDLAGGLARMTDVSPSSLLGYEPIATEYVAHGRARWETPPPMAFRSMDKSFFAPQLG